MGNSLDWSPFLAPKYTVVRHPYKQKDPTRNSYFRELPICILEDAARWSLRDLEFVMATSETRRGKGFQQAGLWMLLKGWGLGFKGLTGS